jgi:signal transduction histidine kinase
MSQRIVASSSGFAGERISAGTGRADARSGPAGFCDLVAGVLGGSRCSLLVARPDGALEVEEAVGFPIGLGASAGDSLGDRVALQVARAGQPLVVNDPAELGDLPQPVGRYATHSFVSFPFRLADGATAVVNVTERGTNEPFGARDVDMLRHLSDFYARAGIAPGPDQQRFTRRREIAIREDERKRLARELHDDAGHRITTAILRVDMASLHAAESEMLRGELQAVRALLTDCVDGLDQTMFALRPRILADFGLISAIRSLANRVREATGVPIELHAGGEINSLNEETALSIFRVAQEAVTNALKHARPARVAVHLAIHEGRLVLDVIDDGIGFDISTIGVSTVMRQGLRGMKERADLVGGHLDVLSRPGRGTTVRAVFPVGGQDNE